MASSNILKFIDHKQQIVTRTKKCFPSQSNTCSRQSPDWFKRKFSLQPQGGYQYRFDDANICKRFKFASQKHSFNIFNNELNLKEDVFDNNKITFHNKKKGVLTEFMDKNGWMKKVIPLMGTQRSPQSRNLNHKDIQKKIQNIKLKKSAYIAAKTATNFYTTKTTIRTYSKIQRAQENGKTLELNQNPQTISKLSLSPQNKSRSSSMKNLFQQKSKLRETRNSTAQNKILEISKMKILKGKNEATNQFHTIDSQFVKNRMAQTAREWGFGHGRRSTADQITRLDSMISQHSTRLKLSQKNYKQLNFLDGIQKNKFASGEI